MYIGDYLGRREIYSPDTLAIIDAGKDPEIRLTYKQWNRRVNQLANWLKEVAGIEKGDRVAILARDGVEHLDTLFACGKLGGIHTALNWRLHWRETASLIEETTPKVLIYSDDFIDAVKEIEQATRGTAAEIKFYLHIEGDGMANGIQFEKAFEDQPETSVSCENLEAEDTACLLFTGGTTGLPKAAQISHRQICWNVLNTVIHDVTHEDIYLCVFPLFHTGGLFAYLSSQIVFGNTTILTRQFEPEQVLELIEREKVTVFAGVPTMFQVLTQAENWASSDMSSLRFCTSGGAPLPVHIVEKFAEEKGIRFKQGFGMTETGPTVFIITKEDAVRKMGSVGKPVLHTDVRIMDPEGRVLGPDQVGELCIRGGNVTTGYWNRPEATAEALVDGWLHSGDAAMFDDEGFYYIVDRWKDMFISGGENVYPAEVENVIYQHPAVAEVAVIGVPHPKWQEVGWAVVVVKEGHTLTEGEVIAFCTGRLAKYKIPKSAVLIDALPRNAAGKVLKRDLRGTFGNP